MACGPETGETGREAGEGEAQFPNQSGGSSGSIRGPGRAGPPGALQGGAWASVSRLGILYLGPVPSLGGTRGAPFPHTRRRHRCLLGDIFTPWWSGRAF